MNILEWLQANCSSNASGYHAHMASPGTFERDGETWTVATNGWSMLAVRGVHAKNALDVDLAKVWPSDLPSPNVDAAKLKAWVEGCEGERSVTCEDCKGAGRWAPECEACDGDGSCTRCGADCEDCGGSGHYPEEECECDGGTVVERMRWPGQLESGWIDRGLLRSVLIGATDERVGVSPSADRNDVYVLAGANWFAVVMPMRPPSERETRPPSEQEPPAPLFLRDAA